MKGKSPGSKAVSLKVGLKLAPRSFFFFAAAHVATTAVDSHPLAADSDSSPIEEAGNTFS
jgi:hypothetical protein